jgi:hypothetical protein
MKYIKAILMLFPLVIGVFLPIVAVVFGLLHLLIDEPKSFMVVFLYCAGIAGITYIVYLLLKYPKTAAPTKIIISLLAVVFFVKSCNEYSGSGCSSSRYIGCDY